MDGQNNNNRKHTILLTVIGVATLLVAIVGATFAYFTASVSGNASNDNVSVTTSTYGLTVAYQDGSNSISIQNKELTKTDAGSNYEEAMGLSVENTGTTAQNFNIDLGNVANTFCQKVASQDASVCDDASGTIDVKDEIYYKVNKCTDDTYTSCTTAVTDTTAAPTTDGSIATNLPVASREKVYYQVVVGIKNIDKVQNYNQGKSFSGKVTVSAVIK